jgi:hypothetical protein
MKATNEEAARRRIEAATTNKNGESFPQKPPHVNSSCHHLYEIRDLVGHDALLLHWPWGEKGPPLDKKGRPLRGWKWKHLTISAMSDPAYLNKLKRGNIGVVLGSKSNKLCVIDLDMENLIKPFMDANPKFASTLRSKGKRACAFWFRVVGDLPNSHVLKFNGDECGEIRADGNQQIIYGQHPDGPTYQIVTRAKPVEIAFDEIVWPEGFSFKRSAPRISGSDPSKQRQTDRRKPHESTASAESTVSTESTVCNSPDWSKTIPTDKGQNHNRLFLLARLCKAAEKLTGKQLSVGDKREVFNRWHGEARVFTKPELMSDDYFFEFLEAYESAAYPLGEDILAKAWEAANSKEPPAAAMQFESEQIRRLVSLCHELQLGAGDRPFHLACRTVQTFFKVKSHKTASSWLKGLVCSGVLELVKCGTLKDRLASEYRYVGGVTK